MEVGVLELSVFSAQSTVEVEELGLGVSHRLLAGFLGRKAHPAGNTTPKGAVSEQENGEA